MSDSLRPVDFGIRLVNYFVTLTKRPVRFFFFFFGGGGGGFFFFFFWGGGGNFKLQKYCKTKSLQIYVNQKPFSR